MLPFFCLQLHFAPDAYELQRQDGVIKLKWNAVPTVFLKSKGDAPDVTMTSDRVYSTSRQERQERTNSRRKVLKSINASIPDHVYAAPEPGLSKTPPINTVGNQQPSQEEETPRSPSPRAEESDDDMVRFPTLLVQETEDDMVRFPTRRVKAPKCPELINLDGDSSASASEVQEIPQNAIRMGVVNGNVVLALPDGLGLAPLVGMETLPESKNVSDSEVDKVQIKRLTDENAKLQEELNKVKRYAERLLSLNARLRQQNRVTSRAYRRMRNMIIRANEDLNNPFSDDETIREERFNEESDEDAELSGTKCGSAVRKNVTKPVPYTAVVKALKQKRKDGSSNELLKLVTQFVPNGSPQNDSTRSECNATDEVF